MLQILINNFAPLTGLLFLVLFLLGNQESDKDKRKLFLLLCLMEFVELLVYNAELWTAGFTKPTLLRILLSAVGYSIRPFLVLFIFHLSVRAKLSDTKMMIFAIPAFFNVLAAFSALFTDLVYSYNEANEFVRGPLGYTSHVVLLFYLLCILVFTFQKDMERQQGEVVLICAICMVILFAVVMEAVTSVHTLGRTAIVLSTIAYYLYFQSRNYQKDLEGYMEQTIQFQKEHLREMSLIGVLAREYVTVCYVDSEKDLVTAYRMDPYIEKMYGEILRAGVTFEQVFRAYVNADIYEEDREFFLNLADVQSMLSYLRQNGSLSRKYRVFRNQTILYCEMRVELVYTEEGREDLIFGFSNNDMRVRREMVYQSAVEQELSEVEEAKASLSGIAELARQLQEAIEDKLSTL